MCQDGCQPVTEQDWHVAEIHPTCPQPCARASLVLVLGTAGTAATHRHRSPLGHCLLFYGLLGNSWIALQCHCSGLVTADAAGTGNKRELQLWKMFWGRWSHIEGGSVEHKAAVAQVWEAEGLLDSSTLGDDCEQCGACWRERAAGCALKCISQVIQRKLHSPCGCSASC